MRDAPFQVETTHVFLKLMESMSKSGSMMVRSKKVVRKKKGSSKNEPPCEGHVAQIHKEGDVFGEHCEEDDVGREVLDRRNVGSLLARLLWIEAGIGGRCFSGLRHCVVGWRFWGSPIVSNEFLFPGAISYLFSNLPELQTKS